MKVYRFLLHGMARPGACKFLVIPWLLVSIIFATGCDYGRMKDDEALQTYERVLPRMPEKTIPVTGGIEVLRTAKPSELHNPLPRTQASMDRGRERFEFYCAQCHGIRADGTGTVGQSFAPLPTNLRSTEVRNQTDGEIFTKVSLGYKRHPRLWDTVSEGDRWAILWYIRSLAEPARS